MTVTTTQPADPIARVLVVDDDAGVVSAAARAARFALRDVAGVTVTVATSPEDALRVVRDAAAPHAPWLALSDFNLGGSIDGIELLDEIARLAPGSRCVLMSGYAEDAVAHRLRESRVEAFVAKPWALQPFAALLRALASSAGGDARER